MEKKITVPPSAVARTAPPSQPGTSTHTTLTSAGPPAAVTASRRAIGSRASATATASASPAPRSRSASASWGTTPMVRVAPASRAAVESAGGPADVTVVCVDVPGCEGGAVLATADRGTVIFFSMATSFSAAALGAEGLAADVTMLVGNGYLPGHAAYALSLLRENPGVHRLFTRRLG